MQEDTWTQLQIHTKGSSGSTWTRARMIQRQTMRRTKRQTQAKPYRASHTRKAAREERQVRQHTERQSQRRTSAEESLGVDSQVAARCVQEPVQVGWTQDTRGPVLLRPPQLSERVPWAAGASLPRQP